MSGAIVCRRIVNRRIVSRRFASTIPTLGSGVLVENIVHAIVTATFALYSSRQSSPAPMRDEFPLEPLLMTSGNPERSRKASTRWPARNRKNRAKIGLLETQGQRSFPDDRHKTLTQRADYRFVKTKVGPKRATDTARSKQSPTQPNRH